jgi:hypothetical protein
MMQCAACQLTGSNVDACVPAADQAVARKLLAAAGWLVGWDSGLMVCGDNTFFDTSPGGKCVSPPDQIRSDQIRSIFTLQGV